MASRAIGRREFMKAAGMGAACAVNPGFVNPAFSGVAGEMGSGKRPNILFVFSDQQRWDTVGCYGAPLFENLTPNLDRMAAEGVRFDRAFTCQPVCGPARSCLQTGKYATETGCYRNGIALPEQERTLAHRLSEGGYEVGYIGKWHLASTHSVPGQENEDYMRQAVPVSRRGGYRDYWLASDVLEFTSHSYDGFMFDGEGKKREFPPDRYRADVLTDWAMEYLSGRKCEKPFFLFLSFIEPHHQNDHKQFEGPRGSKERFAKYRVPGDLVDMEGDWRKEMPDYLGCCWSLDQNVGRLMKHLESMGILEDTLVVYTTDHGCHFKTRNSEYKRSCHDNSIRIPMIVRGPGFRGGKVVSQMVSLIDLPPTLLTAGRAAVPDSMRGRAVQGLAAGHASGWPDEVFVQVSESQVGRAIRTGEWKYCVIAPEKDGIHVSSSDCYAEHELYHLPSDPFEKKNLIDDPSLAETRGRLAGILKRRMVAAGEKEPQIISHSPIK